MDTATAADAAMPDRDIIVSTIRDHWVKRGGTVSSTGSGGEDTQQMFEDEQFDDDEPYYEDEEAEDLQEYMSGDEGWSSVSLPCSGYRSHDKDANFRDSLDFGIDGLSPSQNSSDDKGSTSRYSPLKLPPEISKAISMIDSEDAWKALEREIEVFDVKSPPSVVKPKIEAPAETAWPSNHSRLQSRTEIVEKPSPSLLKSGLPKSAAVSIEKLTSSSSKPASVHKSNIKTSNIKAAKGKTNAAIVIPERSASHTYTKDDFSKYKSKYKMKFEAEEAAAAGIAISSDVAAFPTASVRDDSSNGVFKADVREDARKGLEQSTSAKRDGSFNNNKIARKEIDREIDRPDTPEEDRDGDFKSWASRTAASAFSTKSLPRNFSLERQRGLFASDRDENIFLPPRKTSDLGRTENNIFKKDAGDTGVLDSGTSSVGFDRNSVYERLTQKFSEDSPVPERSKGADARIPYGNKAAGGASEDSSEENSPPVPPKDDPPPVQPKKLPRKTGGIVLYDASQQELPTNTVPATNYFAPTATAAPTTNFFAPLPPGSGASDTSPTEKTATAAGMIGSLFSIFGTSAGGSAGSANDTSTPALQTANGDEEGGKTGTITRSGKRAPPPAQLIILPKPHKEPRESFIAPGQSSVVPAHPSEPVPNAPPQVPAFSKRGASRIDVETTGMPLNGGRPPLRPSIKNRFGEVQSGSFEVASDSDDDTVDEREGLGRGRGPPPTTVSQGFKVSVERANKRNSYLRRSLSNPELAKSLGNLLTSDRYINDDSNPHQSSLTSRFGSDTNLASKGGASSYATLRKPLKSALKAPRKPLKKKSASLMKPNVTLCISVTLTLGRANRGAGAADNGASGSNHRRSSSVDNNHRGFSDLDELDVAAMMPPVQRLGGVRRVQESSISCQGCY
ncbi:hypothetical protein BC829DRAFT_415568 [Chytridium lagenaria]|nr:hypothetical protein BC829DRAFT_415568 [Chytridium lagenaria]